MGCDVGARARLSGSVTEHLRHVVGLMGLTALLFLVGCGGGGTPNTGGGDGETATLRFYITWPARTRAVPVGTESVTITVGDGGEPQRFTVNHPGYAGPTIVVFDGLTPGFVWYRAVASAGRDGTGLLVGEAYGDLTLAAGQTVELSVDAERPWLFAICATSTTGQLTTAPGGTLTMEAIGLATMTASSTRVALEPEVVVWSSSAPRVARIDRRTGVLTGVSEGRAVITARDTSRNLESSIPVVITRGGMPTGDLIPVITVPQTSGDTHYRFAYHIDLRTAAGQDVPTFDVRWDWTDDGVYDTPFLSVHDIDYQFGVQGAQRTRAQVRTPDGRLAEATTVVSVTPDWRRIRISATAIPGEGTTETLFEFTSFGGFELDQHFNWGYIRADWNRDGLYDTDWYPYEDAPEAWRPTGPTRRFDTPGTHTVRVQVSFFDDLNTVDTHDISVVVR